jgi:serine/threonine protein phosphatase PrpC
MADVKQVAISQLSIVDGAWQESPDAVGLFDESALFGASAGRGGLYVVVEVTGDPEGRDALARELIETVRREYAASRGSITLSLMHAVRAANEVIYNINASAPREARRIAGMTAAILRENELFIAQAGAGLVCLVRSAMLTRFPDQSPWFDSNDDAIAEMLAYRNFPTEGAVPMGMRRNYTPDQFHISLQPGDTIVLSTRGLAHLLSNEELLDTLAGRHPDEIIANLEDVAGASDLSVIAIQIADERAMPARVPKPAIEIPLPPPPTRPVVAPREPAPPELFPDEEVVAPMAPPLTREERASAAEPRPVRPRASFDSARARTTMLRATAGAMAGLAAIFSRVDWSRLSAGVDRAISTVSRAMARGVLFILRALMPGESKEERVAPAAPPKLETGWKIAAFVFPVLLVIGGAALAFNARLERQRLNSAQVARLVSDANGLVESAKNVASADKPAARESLQKAIALTEQARLLDPQNPAVRRAFYNASDELDRLNGITVIQLVPSFATFPEPKANPARVVSRYPDVFVLDRGTQRVYRYVVNDVASAAAPFAGDGVILKTGDKVGERTVGELIDLAVVEPGGRVVAVDKSGAFLEYDFAKPGWVARPPRDAAQWQRIILASSYAGNLYLVDSGRSQILRYAPNDGIWTASTTYFAPGINVDLTGVVDIAIDENIWLLRADGSLARFTLGRPNDLALRDLDTPLARPTAIFTNDKMTGIYVADWGNQRIALMDKTTGKFVRQYKPNAEFREAFKSLRALAVDEQSRKFFFISGNQAYFAHLAQ